MMAFQVCHTFSSTEWGLYLASVLLVISEIIKWGTIGSTLKKYKYSTGAHYHHLMDLPHWLFTTLWKSESVSRPVVSDSAISWTEAHQAPLSMEFSRQEYWSRLPFPSSGDLPNPGIKPGFPAFQEDSLLCEPLSLFNVHPN